MRRGAQLLPVALLFVEALLATWILRDVANVTTHRLYVGDRIDRSSRSTAAQRFDIEGTRVVPQIGVRGDERIAFAAARPWPATLRVDARAAAPATYEIHWRQQTRDEVLARGRVESTATIAAAVPSGPGVVEFVTHGAVTWIDPRLVDRLRATKRGLLLILLATASIALGMRAQSRLRTFKWMAAAGGCLMSVAVLEVGMRALGDRAPSDVLAERHDLGEVRRDPRWQYTLRYGRRLLPKVNQTSEWRHGDIVRMGFIPADTTPSFLHRFAFRTDAEGFRNERTRDRIDIAALGDSFTDAMTVDAADAWPSILERDTGVAVQNYGTAGFGPQQELRVLTDFALRHRPRFVVLAYFAGNDIFDAEAFEEYERSNGTVRRPDPGWPIKSVVSVADTWFVVSAVRAMQRWAATRERAEARTAGDGGAAGGRRFPAGTEVASGDGGFQGGRRFDRGMFAIDVNGRTLRFAFMPPYLNTLTMTEGSLAARRGWQLTKSAIGAMQAASRAAGAELVVMFIPFKSQVYLPLLPGSLPPDELTSALRYYLPDMKVDVDALLRNRLAQNRMMRQLCDSLAVRFVDTTEPLSARVREGDNVYFPDESHLNELGHLIVANAIRAALDQK